MPEITTCSTCPLSHQIEGTRYRCEAPHKIGLEVVRENWTATPDCDDAIAKHKKEVTLPTLPRFVSGGILPPEKTALPTTRLEVYALPEPDRYVVYSFKPAYFTPKKHKVRYNGGGVWSCTCPHHQHRRSDANFNDKHIAAVKAKLASHSSRLTREPVLLTAARGFFKPTFMAWLGGKQLGYVSNQAEGEILGNSFFITERSRQQMTKQILSSY